MTLAEVWAAFAVAAALAGIVLAVGCWDIAHR